MRVCIVPDTEADQGQGQGQDAGCQRIIQLPALHQQPQGPLGNGEAKGAAGLAGLACVIRGQAAQDPPEGNEPARACTNRQTHDSGFRMVQRVCFPEEAIVKAHVAEVKESQRKRPRQEDGADDDDGALATFRATGAIETNCRSWLLKENVQQGL